MKQVIISGDIAVEHFWESDTTEKDVREQLDACAPGEDVQIVIDSPGGSVFAGISIFNDIREFARTHSCEVVIKSLAGSAASFIALAAKVANPENKIKVYDNSVFFIHNAQSFASGDFHVFEKEARDLKMFSDMICDSAYAKVSGDSPKEIHKAMDEETFYVGQEIVNHGYADEVIDGEDDVLSEGRNSLVAQGKTAYEACMQRYKNWIEKTDTNKKAAAKLSESFYAGLKNKITAENDEKFSADGMEDSCMKTVEELKAQNPELYNQIFDAGVAKERARVSAHLKMAGDSGDVSASVDFIKNGTAVSDDAVTAKYHEVFCKTQLIAARVQDNVPAVQVPEEGKTDAKAEMLNAYYAKMGVKEAK